MKNPVGWFEIYVDDMDRAKAFYETVLGINLEPMSDPTDDSVTMWSFPSAMEAYGASGALIKMAGQAAGGSSTVVYFACDDCAEEESRVAAAGGVIKQSKMSIGDYGFCALAVDTEGNSIGLHSHK